MSTVFSKIVRGEIPSYTIAEDDRFYAFLDINPVQRGHTLVIPKSEVDYYFDIDDEDIGEMSVFAKRVAEQIKAHIPCKKVAVVVIGLEVPHAHIHLIPISRESDINFRETLKLTPEEFEDIASKIRF